MEGGVNPASDQRAPCYDSDQQRYVWGHVSHSKSTCPLKQRYIIIPLEQNGGLSVRKPSLSLSVNQPHSLFCLLALRPLGQRISRAKREEKLKLPLLLVMISDSFSEGVENYD